MFHFFQHIPLFMFHGVSLTAIILPVIIVVPLVVLFIRWILSPSKSTNKKTNDTPSQPQTPEITDEDLTPGEKIIQQGFFAQAENRNAKVVVETAATEFQTARLKTQTLWEKEMHGPLELAEAENQLKITVVKSNILKIDETARTNAASAVIKKMIEDQPVRQKKANVPALIVVIIIFAISLIAYAKFVKL